MTRPPGVRTAPTGPRLDPRDRPDEADLAAQRRAANPRKPGRRPAPSTITPKERT